MPRITILLCLWDGWRPLYSVENVRPLVRMLRHYLRIPHKVVLLTDFEATKEETEVDDILPLPYQPDRMEVKHGINCFRRLRFFDPKYTEQFGTEWVMSLDLDTLILEDITETIEYAMHPFGFSVIRGRLAERNGHRPYNGSMYCIKVGEHSHVWDEFDWEQGPKACAAAGWRGSDQVWMCLKIPNAPTLGPEHGVYFLGQYLQSDDSDPEPKIINYAGMNKPWSRTSLKQTPELYQEYQRWV